MGLLGRIHITRFFVRYICKGVPGHVHTDFLHTNFLSYRFQMSIDQSVV